MNIIWMNVEFLINLANLAAGKASWKNKMIKNDLQRLLIKAKTL